MTYAHVRAVIPNPNTCLTGVCERVYLHDLQGPVSVVQHGDRLLVGHAHLCIAQLPQKALQGKASVRTVAPHYPHPPPPQTHQQLGNGFHLETNTVIFARNMCSVLALIAIASPGVGKQVRIEVGKKNMKLKRIIIYII